MSKAFSESIEIIIWFLSFNLLMWCITLIDLGILKNPCIPGIKPSLSLLSFLIGPSEEKRFGFGEVWIIISFMSHVFLSYLRNLLPVQDHRHVLYFLL